MIHHYASMFLQDPTYDNLLKHLKHIFGEKTPLYALHMKMFKKYGEPEIGRNRATYLARTHVVKLPISYDGFADNDWEGSLLSDEEMRLARTRLVYFDEVPILLMERVTFQTFAEIESSTDPMAQQTLYASDSFQVGLSKRNNQIVCYDYGLR